MRSAIFDSDRRSPSYKPLSRSRQGSPSISNQVRKRQALANSSPLTWNLEEMLAAYNETRSLPPLLSPTLPATLPGDDVDDSDRKRKVRWVNKMDDKKPRFLVRFLYKVTGLGILVSNKLRDKPLERMKKPEEGLKEKISDKVPNKLEKLSEKSVKREKPQAQERQDRPLDKPQVKQERQEKHDKEVKPDRVESQDKQGKTQVKTQVKTTEKQDYIKCKTHWIRVAKETKFISNKTEGILSLIIELDALISYTISYYYDDKLKQAMNVPPLDRYWNELLKDLSSTIEKASTFVNQPKYSAIKSQFKCLVGLLHLFCSVVFRRINSIYLQLPRMELKVIENYKIIDQHIKQTEIVCPQFEFCLKSNFPNIWDKRCKDFSQIIESVLPMQFNYYLPVNSYTKLGEFTRLFYHILNEFIGIYNNAINEDLIYSLKSGLSGP